MRYIRRVIDPSPHPAPGAARLSVRSAAERTAALVNVLTGADPTADEVTRVLREHGEAVPAEGLGADGLTGLRQAAALLRTVFAATGPDEAAARLNGVLARTPGPLRLTSHGGTTPWHPHLDRDDEEASWGEWLLASSALALTVLVWERQRPPGGVCASPSCGRVFLTSGGGPERRYCSRRCATRERVAAHRRTARHRAAPPGGEPGGKRDRESGRGPGAGRGVSA
ncbi:CGNR zinc finger domain-containing protein [Streptomyces sp. NPDC000594]|uniref:CGNR zinc finger domain-containing protein n=1 Tax=Streptomyces sp. NPDC000594 TaxID=3154261 RepID=UPI00332251D2